MYIHIYIYVYIYIIHIYIYIERERDREREMHIPEFGKARGVGDRPPVRLDTLAMRREGASGKLPRDAALRQVPIPMGL